LLSSRLCFLSSESRVLAQSIVRKTLYVIETTTAELGGAHPPATTNPFDPARTAGGSSSGSAAAVAAHMIPAAIGTQVGGSIIRPAAFCGNVALKPTQGGINRGERQATSMSTHGVHAGCVEDMWQIAIEIADRAGGDRGCVDQNPECVSERTKATLGKAEAMTVADYRAALIDRETAQQCYARVAPLADATITLSCPGPAPLWSGDTPGKPLAPRPTGDPVFNFPSSMLFAPVATMPLNRRLAHRFVAGIAIQSHQPSEYGSVSRSNRNPDNRVSVGRTDSRQSPIGELSNCPGRQPYPWTVGQLAYCPQLSNCPVRFRRSRTRHLDRSRSARPVRGRAHRCKRPCRRSARTRGRSEGPLRSSRVATPCPPRRL
jgi:Asp-tRNA(Asn)/Glu-tRNA(Gln) amidotransferase A subunit family amidase